MMKRIDGIDLMKGIAILEVLILHTYLIGTIQLPALGSEYLPYLKYFIRLASEGVPIFVFVNGFLLLGKKNYSLERHWHKTLHLLVIFLVVAAVWTIIGAMIDGERLSFSAFINYILLTASGSAYTGPLWFLENLIALYLIYPILEIVYEQDKRIFTAMFYILSAFIFIPQVVNYIQILHASETLQNINYFIERINPFQNSWFLFCFMMGGICHIKIELVKKHHIALTVLLFVSWIIAFLTAAGLTKVSGQYMKDWFNYSSIFMAVMLIGLFAFLLPVKCNIGAFSPLKRFISLLGKHSMGIYLTHFIWIKLWWRCLPGNSAPMRVKCFVCVTVVSLLTSVMLQKIPYVNRLLKL